MRLRNAATFIGTSFAAGVASNVVLADPVNTWENGYGHMAWGGGYGMFGGLMMLVFWGIVIALIVVAVRWFGAQNTSQGNPATPLDILKTRFANGELDEDEFHKRKAALEN